VTLAAYRLQADAVPLPSEAPDCVIAKNQHGSYCVPRSSLHRPAARAIVNGGVWESETLDLLRSAGPDGDIVHAGTFFGDFIPALTRSRQRDARVWAFEPNRESYECARLTVMLNGLENVTLSHAGLSAESTSALLATRNANGLPLGGGSHLIADPARAPGIGSEQVHLVAVDDVVSSDRPVAVIQLDVEGHEQEALAGAMRTIARWRPLIVLETVPPESWISEHLAPLGYRVAGSVDANTVVRQRRSQTTASSS
jgi:FkbM family methyltransferase